MPEDFGAKNGFCSMKRALPNKSFFIHYPACQPSLAMLTGFFPSYFSVDSLDDISYIPFIKRVLKSILEYDKASAFAQEALHLYDSLFFQFGSGQAA